ncbi:MAG: hypothetical protein ABIO76_10005, partial [Ginsengibacter sp.]
NFPGALFEYAIDSDINHALHESITNHNANMLAMVPHKHEWIEKLFKKSETKEMIFHTEVPLLILPESHNNIHVFLKKETKELAANPY